MNLVKTSENEAMSCYLYLESVIQDGASVQFVEIINFKKPQFSDSGELHLSTKVFEVINLSTCEQTIFHMEIYPEEFAEGECIRGGMRQNSTRSIPKESLSYQNYLYLKDLLGKQ